MKRRKTVLPNDLRSEPGGIQWAGLFNDPGMVPAERLEEALADGWADDIDRANQPDLSDGLREELDQRIAEDDANPEAGSPWPEAKRRILSSL
jgi:hypothetical protein